ncbi:MAG: hypothetical protein R3357_05790 [Burkholderiales bacterium]|nr:hypothetical protein [Burkholderiales bacterium]
MADISTQQLAELLSGIARAQAAIVQGMESAMPGTRSTHVVPALQNAAHLRDHPDPTLVDLPVRVLLAYMGRVGPDVANIVRDLERALSGLPPMAAGSAPEFSAPGAGAGDSLDFSEPK